MGVHAKQIKPIAEYINEEKTVRDIMKPLEAFSSVSADTSLRNAVYILKNCVATQNLSPDTNYLLVFENKSLIGFVGIYELFASVQPPNLREDWYQGWNVSNWVEPVFMKGLFTRLCSEVAEKPVRDVVEPITVTLCTESTLEEAVLKFYREKRLMIPVMDNDMLVGIVRACDLFDELANIIS
ncbi:MAG: CBS domain-containing protein [Peptococcaceae bacterium]|nr:CBS domain-containing protein [Peptococcaceae bacterium]